MNKLTAFFLQFQEYAQLAIRFFAALKHASAYRHELRRELFAIGAQSLPVVILGGTFIGTILAIETGHRYEAFGAKTMVGRTVALGMVRELGPLVAGLLLSARTGAKNASEIGAMKLSEQVDALRAIGSNPVSVLVVPRVLASVIMFLPLTLFADAGGMLGGLIVADASLHIDRAFFWTSAIYGLQMKDLLVGFLKPFFFGFFIGTISCHFGLSTTGGTQGLGRATINAVVISSLVVLLVDFIFTKVVWEVL
ncbi:MAG TPA: ABC transporter permease [Bacteroidota bacterium]|nr:ABC transporter permease [Bacteroidota bacterium]